MRRCGAGRAQTSLQCFRLVCLRLSLLFLDCLRFALLRLICCLQIAFFAAPQDQPQQSRLRLTPSSPSEPVPRAVKPTKSPFSSMSNHECGIMSLRVARSPGSHFSMDCRRSASRATNLLLLLPLELGPMFVLQVLTQNAVVGAACGKSFGRRGALESNLMSHPRCDVQRG